MPKATFVLLVRETLKANGITEGYVIEDAGLIERFFAKEKLMKVMVDAYVKLRKFAFIRDTKSLYKNN